MSHRPTSGCLLTLLLLAGCNSPAVLQGDDYVLTGTAPSVRFELLTSQGQHIFFDQLVDGGGCADAEGFCWVHPFVTAERSEVLRLRESVPKGEVVSIFEASAGYYILAEDSERMSTWRSTFDNDDTLLRIDSVERNERGEWDVTAVFEATRVIGFFGELDR